MIKNLLNTLKNKKKKAKGFTLIELIIVIAIIAILAAIAIPKFMEIRENGNEKSDISTAKNIQTTIASLIADDKISINQDITVDDSESNTTGQAIIDNLQDKPAVKSAKGKDKGTTYYARVDKRGNIRIFVGSIASGNQIYPDGEVFNK